MEKKQHIDDKIKTTHHELGIVYDSYNDVDTMMISDNLCDKLKKQINYTSSIQLRCNIKPQYYTVINDKGNVLVSNMNMKDLYEYHMFTLPPNNIITLLFKEKDKSDMWNIPLSLNKKHEERKSLTKLIRENDEVYFLFSFESGNDSDYFRNEIIVHYY